MDEEGRRILEVIRRVAEGLPSSVVGDLAGGIENGEGKRIAALRGNSLSLVSDPGYRAAVKELFDAWESAAPGMSPEAMGAALLAASHGEQHRGETESVELVWTGPATEATPLRRTDQALMGVIREARERLTVVSYAVYRIPKVGQALREAAGRGVRLRIVLESAEESEGKVEYDNLRALGDAVARVSSVFIWPREKREKDTAGRHGSLHAKCAVADGNHLLVSSANLTEYALSLNMELGLLIKGGEIPGRVEKHFERLVEKGILVQI